MAENVTNKPGESKTPPTPPPPTTGQPTPSAEKPNTDGKPISPPNNNAPPQKPPEEKGPKPPVEKPKEQGGDAKPPEAKGPDKSEKPDGKKPPEQKKPEGKKPPAPKKPEQSPKATDEKSEKPDGKKPPEQKKPEQPPKVTDKKPEDKKPPEPPKPEKEAAVGEDKKEPPKAEPPPPAPVPVAAPRSGEKEQIVHIKLSDLHPFKDHPFQVRKDEEMHAMVESVKDKGVTQPAVVRPREGGGYEMVSGHRRQQASALAGFVDMPCIVRNLTDEEAITQMVEDNTTQREAILPSERAKALKMQLDAIKRQGIRSGDGKRSNEIVAERNNMTVKQVQRYIKLNDLVPELMELADNAVKHADNKTVKKLGLTVAVELAFIGAKNQQYIAVAIEGQQSTPSIAQAQCMRELDQQRILKPDTIDGIMLEEKKEVDKVILSSHELAKYFGKDKTPREMKNQIMKLLDEWASKEKKLAPPDRKQEHTK